MIWLENGSGLVEFDVTKALVFILFSFFLVVRGGGGGAGREALEVRNLHLGLFIALGGESVFPRRVDKIQVFDMAPERIPPIPIAPCSPALSSRRGFGLRGPYRLRDEIFILSRGGEKSKLPTKT